MVKQEKEMKWKGQANNNIKKKTPNHNCQPFVNAENITPNHNCQPFVNAENMKISKISETVLNFRFCEK